MLKSDEEIVKETLESILQREKAGLETGSDFINNRRIYDILAVVKKKNPDLKEKSFQMEEQVFDQVASAAKLFSAELVVRSCLDAFKNKKEVVDVENLKAAVQTKDYFSFLLETPK